MFHVLNKTIWGHKNIDVNENIQITVPTITYASENWTIRGKISGKHNGNETRK